MRVALFWIVLSFAAGSAFAQATVDTHYLKNLYDHSIELDESKADSIAYYAGVIEREARKLNFNKGGVLSLRLKGIAAEYQGNYSEALEYYYGALEAAMGLADERYEISALGDLAIVHSNMKNSTMAKQYYLQIIDRVSKQGNDYALVLHLSNLGAVYNKQELPDSALFYLNKALSYSKDYHSEADLTSIYNNMGNAWFLKKQWNKALGYFRRNHEQNLRDGDRNMLWYDVLNIADVYIEKGESDSAMKYLQIAQQTAVGLGSYSKKADTYGLFAKYYSRRGDYRNAFLNLQDSYSLDTFLVNRTTNTKMAELQERFKAREREQENRLLHSEVERVNLRNRNFALLMIGSFLLAAVVGISFMLIRKRNQKLQEKNELIERQNERLSDLNAEKNSLISIVSHDLSGPFTGIKMWSQILKSNTDNLTEEQRKALARIESSADNGEYLIRNILDIEKAETNSRKLQLCNFDLGAFTREMCANYRQEAGKKQVGLHYAGSGNEVYVLSDPHMVSRILENLLSNAIKFTPSGRSVWVGVEEEPEHARICVRDEGVGIIKEEIPMLFTKYSKLSARPTNGESSTGLGLAIVKRIVDELNGQVTCESEAGKGTLFTVVLKK